MVKLNLNNTTTFTSHRYGWGYAMNHLKYLHSNSGIDVDDFIEKNFSWNIEEKKPVYRKKWVGFLHNPPNIPLWFDYFHSPQEILKRPYFQESLKSCLCLIVLSDYLKNWLEEKVNIPVFSVKHPTGQCNNNWSIRKYLHSKRKIIQLGYWLRDLDSFTVIDTGIFKKVWFPSHYKYAIKLYHIYNQSIGVHPEDVESKLKNIFISNHLSNEDYDEELSKSVVYLKLYDSSANNAIIECISRSTPVVVNKLPAVVEYLGENYPLYHDFENNSISDLLNDDRIIQAHNYLKNMNKEFLKGEYFVSKIKKYLKKI